MKLKKPFLKVILGSSLLTSGLSTSSLMAAEAQGGGEASTSFSSVSEEKISRAVQLSYNSNIILANAGRPENNSETIELLERGFTCVDRSFEAKRTALMQAILGENPELVAHMLRYSQDVKKDLQEKDLDGNTALHLLLKEIDSQKPFQIIMELLIISGASWDVKNDEGETPLDLWAQNIMVGENDSPSPEEIKANIKTNFPGAFVLLSAEDLANGEFFKTRISSYFAKVHPSTLEYDYHDF